MAKTLSAYNITKTDGLYVSPVRLVVMEFSTTTLYLCDRSFGGEGARCIFDDQIYEPLILSMDSIQMGPIKYESDYQADPGEASFSIDNSIPVGGYDRFSALVDAETTMYSDVTIYEIFEGAALEADLIPIFAGSIEEIREVKPESATVVCSSFDVSLKNKFQLEICNDDDYPNADPSDIGKMLPQIYGSCTKVPLVAIDVGVLTTVSEDVTRTATSVILTSVTGLSTSGTILVDAEEITYTGITGTTLTGCTRGASSTIAVTHNSGAAVGEVRSAYIYAAGNPVKAIDAAYCENVLQDTANYTAYTGQSGDEHGTYGGRAVLSFSDWPKIENKTDLSGDITMPAYWSADYIPKGERVGLTTYDAGTTVQFQAAPSGTLSNIYIDITWSVAPPEGGTLLHSGAPCHLLIGGRVIGYVDSLSVFTAYASSTIRIPQTSWQTSISKTASYMSSAAYGLLFMVESAVQHADVDGGNPIGPLELESSNIPVGEVLSSSSIDTGTSITFAAAPETVGVEYIEITYTWTYQEIGSRFSGDTTYQIDGKTVCEYNSGTLYTYYPSTFTVTYSSWQTSITKTASAYSGTPNNFEAFVVTSAVQKLYTTNIDSPLSGNQMADSVIGGAIAIDCDGYQDDGSGTYTGTASALIERPDHILKHLIINRCGLAAANINSTLYTSAGTYYSTQGYTLAFPIMQAPDVRALLHRIAYQSRSLEFWEAGEHCIVQVPDVTSSDPYDHTVTANRIDLRQIWIDNSLRADIKNTLSARYDRDWSGYSDETTECKNVVYSTDADSITKYGALEGDQVALPYVKDASHAEDILKLWVRVEKSDTRLIVGFSGGFWLTQFERGDVFVFSFDDGDYLDDALSGRITSEETQFRVLDMVRRPDASIQIEAISAAPSISLWVEHFDDSDWSIFSWRGTWDTDHYDSAYNIGASGLHEVSLVPAGSWSTSYDPSSVRITFTGGGSVYLEITSSGGPFPLWPAVIITSGGEESLASPMGDISYLKLYSSTSSFVVTNIEFLE